jgi:chemotaxis protein MotA
MDIATIIGLLTSVGAIGLAYSMEGGNLDAVFLTAPILIVMGGTLGATTVTTSIDTVIRVPKFLKVALVHRTYPLEPTIQHVVRLAEKARREGILGLEAELKNIGHPFFRKALQLVIDGTEVTALREVLETDIAYLEERHRRGIEFFQRAGGFAPTMGILGTVLGLVHTLANTDDAARMASAIASAFIATLWGVGIANLFFLPISDKLRRRHREEVAFQELIMEGVIALQSGETPRNIRTRLLSFIPARQRAGDL